MAKSKQADILSQLAARFEQAPVVVWHDPAGEFRDLARDSALAGELSAEVLTADEGALALKCRVNALAPGERLLVYRACAEPDVRGDWRADAELYAARFSADATSLLLADLGAADTPEMRAAAQRYRAFLRRAANLRRVRALAGDHGFADARDLDLAVMLAAMGKEAPLDAAEVAAAYLAAAGEDADAAWTRLSAAGAGERFAAMLHALAGLDADPAGLSCARVSAHVLSRALAWRLGGGAGTAQNEFCFRVLLAWRRRAPRSAIADTCAAAFGATSGLTLDEALEQDVSWQAEELVVGELLRRVAALSCDTQEVLARTQDRKASYWYEVFGGYYRVAALIARMRAFRDAHADGFSGAAVELWDAYQRDYFRMDQLYRRLRAAAGPCLISDAGGLDEALRPALEWAENLYKGWYLARLGEAWDAAVADDFRERGFVPGIDRADSFYALYAQGLKGRSACATVIISDALRYEVAEELSRALEQTAKGTVELRAQMAPFPSITPLGMAALLPHGALRLADDCKGALADGVPSAGLARRQKILRDASHQGVPGAVALSASDFLQMSAKERRSLGRDAGLVYLYHNVIDTTGENDEDRLPAACEDAVEELAALVRAASTSFGPNVIATADHGFVYTATPLDSLDKVGKDEVSGEVVCVTHRRAVLARSGATSDTLLSVSLAPAGRADLTGFTPRGCLRVRQPGAGDRFVHGGISLQEVCAPVLRFHAARGRAKGPAEAEPATLSLLSTGRVITDAQPIVAFHQDAAAGGRVLPAVYRARFEAADGSPLSDEPELHADRTAVDGEAGTVRVRFSLRAAPGAGPEAFLVLRDASSGEEALRERFELRPATPLGEADAW